jgi:hypothetical protein
MSRSLNGFVVLLSVSVLGANLWLVKPHPEARVPVATAEPVAAPVPVPVRQSVPSPFAYIHEDGSEEYLPAGISFEEVHAGSGFLDGEPLESRNAVYSWSSAGAELISASPSSR